VTFIAPYDVVTYYAKPPSASSRQLNGPVIVAMIFVRMMQASIHEIIDMVAVRNYLMPTRRTMGMRAVRFWRTGFLIWPPFEPDT
jgi:hypothetical protein